MKYMLRRFTDMSTDDDIMGDSDDDIEQVRKAEYYRKKKAVKGDWAKAEEIYKNYPDDVRAVLGLPRFNCGDTALHVAAAAGRNEFVKQLVSKYLKDEDLEMKNYEENMEFVLLMLEKNMELPMIRNIDEKLLVQMAALLGHEEMVKQPLNDLIELLIILIDNDLYDFALLMVQEFPELAIVRAKPNRDFNSIEGETALHALARKPMMKFNDNSKQGMLKRFYNRRTNKRMHPEARKLVEHLRENAVDKLEYKHISDLVKKPFKFISVAAKEGNIEFLSIFPSLILEVNEGGYTIFHTAVLYRHKSILTLIHELPSMKDVIFALRVREEFNNILHLAAKLPPDQDRLNVGAGAAFQMQRVVVIQGAYLLFIYF
ncbi:hypothetical protein EZV62_027675 [Acer yangbiense]|uniref:Uncharacterized protein n=1 Tax=Acer yangbiense TaxID=1000413 RepID=A0A5C7GUC7_9ROSI|nr:hypothetical protein EZV62_027675 [Acer yangbiense]